MSNGTPFFLGAEKAQGLANYPHARLAPTTTTHRTIYVSGTSSRRGDGTWDGVTDNADGSWTLDVKAQTAAVLRNLETIIQGATNGKGGLNNIIDATVFLIDLPANYSGMNEEWNRVWPDRADAPARTTIGVKELPNPRLLVEIKCTVVVEAEA
ncbi:L-PSP endoribonuclease family protein [Aspergillus rambellii]|uniref:L-PSP endoribonuclease family protein n=2 Tax=Aspergillus subgen. Nidulantes TaxID=2720870 RepID=A0A0F8X882_9EURO|nr:L-PSP endoribonuclease family protein [Aspergillus rambellii]KKK24014.1 L-PSP endoribonuclease family protein [Aspergillus ochraceoroseus]